MTPKTQASQIVQKHYKIIESHLPIHSMTDTQMMKIAKEHAVEEVKLIIELPSLQEGKMLAILRVDYYHWNCTLDEIETI